MKGRGARAGVVALFLVLVVLAAGSMAAAHSSGVPRTVLRTGNATQDGKLVNASWTSFDGTFCVTQISDGTPTFPAHAATWKPGSKIRIQLRKKQRPDQLTIRSWASLRNERPVGAGELVSYGLSRTMRKGRYIWVASFTPKVTSHLYLRIRSSWVDTGSECGGVQMGTWQFHVVRAL
ncbi:MAG: hypothetical protein QOH26_593 [Actinomycetota bacterium]|jgi:hypothetical protein|nr:hypothetical protein [Actinomycetota bacterium]